MTKTTDQHNIDQRALRNVLGNYPTGVAVVTANDGADKVVSMVVGTFSSVSLEPPLISYMPRKESKTFEELRKYQNFSVHVLAYDQADLSSALTRGSTNGEPLWSIDDAGRVIIDDVLARIDCTVSDIVDAGDHYIVLGEIHEFTGGRQVAPLIFFQGSFGGFASYDTTSYSSKLAEAVSQVSETQTHLEKLSRYLKTEVSVLGRVDDDFFTVGLSPYGDPINRLGTRHPVLAPLGELFVAWNTDEQDKWLNKITEEDVRNMLERRLERVRERGWSLSLRNTYRKDEVLAALKAYREPFLSPAIQRDIEAVIKQADKYYEDTELASTHVYEVEAVVVPVEDSCGEISFVLRAYFGGEELTGTQIQECAQEMKNMAQQISQDIRQGAHVMAEK